MLTDDHQQTLDFQKGFVRNVLHMRDGAAVTEIEVRPQLNRVEKKQKG